MSDSRSDSPPYPDRVGVWKCELHQDEPIIFDVYLTPWTDFLCVWAEDIGPTLQEDSEYWPDESHDDLSGHLPVWAMEGMGRFEFLGEGSQEDYEQA